MLSQDLTQILDSPLCVKHWDLRVQFLLLRQQALELEAALAAKLQARPIPRPEGPARSAYRSGYRDLIPAQFLRPASINTIADAMVVFGD